MRQGYDLLRALGSVSCDVSHETVVRLVAGIGFCVSWFHTRHKGYDLLRALGFAPCEITQETGGTICYGHWILCLVISHTRQEVRFLMGISF